MLNRSLHKVIFAPVITALTLGSLIIGVPTAFATTTPFNCNGTDASGGTYTVTDGTLDGSSVGSCTSSSLVLDSSITTIEADLNIPNTLTSVSIPSTVTSIGYAAFLHADSITDYVVDPANLNYESIAGVLFSHDGTTLIQYPAAKSTATYTVPASVTTIGSYSFFGTQLVSLQLPPNLLNLGGGAIQSNPNLVSISALPASLPFQQSMISRNNALAAINVDASHLVDDPQNPGTPLPAQLKSIDGVLFSADGTYLYLYSEGKPGSSYTVPDGVQAIDTIWSYGPQFSRLILPASIQVVSPGSLNLHSVTLMDSSIFTAENGAWQNLFGAGPLLVNDCNPSTASSDASNIEQASNVTLICEPSAPDFTLSQGNIGYVRNTVISGSRNYHITATVAPDSYSIYPHTEPYGLNFNTSTGLIYGTPNQNFQATWFTITGSNALGDSSHIIRVAVGDPVSLTAPADNSTLTAQVGTNFSNQITYTGGIGDVFFSVSNGSLPDGVTLDTDSGLISGTPTRAGTYTFDFAATDMTRHDVNGSNITITVAPAPPHVEWAAPLQTDSIASTELGCDATSSPLILHGKFSTPIMNISINGKNLDKSQWVQTGTTLTITPKAGTSEALTILIYNGSTPILSAKVDNHSASCTPAPAVVAPTPTPTPSATPTPAATPTPTPAATTTPAPATTVVKKPAKPTKPAKVATKTIVCVKGKKSLKVSGTKPICPKGYSVKK